MLLYIERGESMKKFTSLVACLIEVLGLSSCTNTYSNYIDSDNTDAEKPAMMKEIKFDNTFIQTNNATWPIAFKSYYIKNESCRAFYSTKNIIRHEKFLHTCGVARLIWLRVGKYGKKSNADRGKKERLGRFYDFGGGIAKRAFGTRYRHFGRRYHL